MARDRADIIRRIRACLAIAVPASNAPAPERETAKRMAQKMMLEHGIQAHEVLAAGAQPRRQEPEPPAQRDYDEGVTIVINVGGFNFAGRMRHNFQQGFSAFEGFDVNTSNGSGAGGEGW